MDAHASDIQIYSITTVGNSAQLPWTEYGSFYYTQRVHSIHLQALMDLEFLSSYMYTMA